MLSFSLFREDESKFEMLKLTFSTRWIMIFFAGTSGDDLGDVFALLLLIESLTTLLDDVLAKIERVLL